MQTTDRIQSYEDLIVDIRNMVYNRGRGFRVAEALKDEMWDDLEAHEKRLSEQIENLKADPMSERLQDEISNADSIYEAARSYYAKFPKADDLNQSTK